MTTTKVSLELPSPPTFAQMIEDLELISSDEKFSSLIPREQGQTNSPKVLPSSLMFFFYLEQSHHLIHDYLIGFEHLQRLDASLTIQNDSTHDELERKLHNIIEQLQTCLNKLQTKHFPSDKK